MVTVNIASADRLALLIIYLLVNEIGRNSLAYVVSLDTICGFVTDRQTTLRNAVLAFISTYGLIDLVLVPCNVVAEVPGEVLCLDDVAAECAFDTEVMERTNVGIDLV